jgi:hypothetical protein
MHGHVATWGMKTGAWGMRQGMGHGAWLISAPYSCWLGRPLYVHVVVMCRNMVLPPQTSIPQTHAREVTRTLTTTTAALSSNKFASTFPSEIGSYLRCLAVTVFD